MSTVVSYEDMCTVVVEDVELWIVTGIVGIVVAILHDYYVMKGIATIVGS